MKKNKILAIITILIMLTSTAYAINLTEIKLENSHIRIYLDFDSLKEIENKRYYKVFYIDNIGYKESIFVSDCMNNMAGVATTQIYDREKLTSRIDVASLPKTNINPIKPKTLIYPIHNSVCKLEQNSQGKFSEKQVDFTPFLRNLDRRIKMNWIPPKGTYKVEVNFTVSKTGKVLDYKIQSDVSYEIKNAIIKAIIESQPFLMFPNDFNEESIEIKYTFENNEQPQNSYSQNNQYNNVNYQQQNYNQTQSRYQQQQRVKETNPYFDKIFDTAIEAGRQQLFYHLNK